MGDMGGMTGMNAAPQQMSSPSTGFGDKQMEQMLEIDGKMASGFQGKLNPGVLEGPSTVGGGIAGMNSMKAAPDGWDKQPTTETFVDPDRGFINKVAGEGDIQPGMDYSQNSGGIAGMNSMKAAPASGSSYPAPYDWNTSKWNLANADPQTIELNRLIRAGKDPRPRAKSDPNQQGPVQASMGSRGQGKTRSGDWRSMTGGGSPTPTPTPTPLDDENYGPEWSEQDVNQFDNPITADMGPGPMDMQQDYSPYNNQTPDMDPSWNDPVAEAFGPEGQDPMQQPEVFPGNEILGQQQGEVGDRPGNPGQIPQKEKTPSTLDPFQWQPDTRMGGFSYNDMKGFYDDALNKMEEATGNPYGQGELTPELGNDIQQDIIDSAADKSKNNLVGRSSFAGGQAQAGGDALSNALSGGPQSDFTEAQVAGPETDSSPTTSQFNEEVAPSVSGSPAISTPQSGFEQDDLGRVEATPRGIQQSEEDANAMVDEMAEKGFVYNEETKKFDQSGVAPTVSMPPAGVKNWKGDDTPFEPVLRDDRFISKSDTERPDTPEIAGGPAGSKPEVGEDTYEDFVSSWEAKAKDIRTNPGDWVKDPDVGRQAQRNTKTGESWDPEEMYRRNVERNNKRDAEEALLPPKTGQVTIDGKHYWKASDIGKPGVPESGTFAANGRLVAIDGKDVWGDPEADKPEPSWEGWGSVGPDRKEEYHKQYGKARIDKYVKENNGNSPPFDEWDKEGQDKPALEEFKDKVDAGEVSDEEPAPKPASEMTGQERKEHDERVRKYNRDRAEMRRSGVKLPAPDPNMVLTDEQDKASAVWRKFNLDMSKTEAEGVLKELGIDKDYMLKMQPVGGNSASDPRRTKGGITMFKGPDGRRFQRKVTQLGNRRSGKTWTEIKMDPAQQRAENQRDSEGIPRPGDDNSKRVTANNGEEGWKLSNRGQPGIGNYGDFVDENGEIVSFEEPEREVFNGDPNARPWDGRVQLPQEAEDAGTLRESEAGYLTLDKFSEVGDAAYGDEERRPEGYRSDNPDDWYDTIDPIEGFGPVEEGDQAPKADASSASPEDLNNPDNWDTSGGQYTYRGAEFGKTNTNPPADTEDWAQTRAAAASRSGAAGGELPERGQDQLVGEEERRHLDGGTNLTTPGVSRPPAGETMYLGDGKDLSSPEISLPPESGDAIDLSNNKKIERRDRDDYDLAPELSGVPLDVMQDSDGNIDYGGNMLVSNAGGLTKADMRRRGVKPSQIQALVNNQVAQNWGEYNQAAGGTGLQAQQGMSIDTGTESQRKISPLVQSLLGSRKAEIDIPWQYAMQHAGQVRDRRELAHQLGLQEAGMTAQDFYADADDRLAREAVDRQLLNSMYNANASSWNA
jgi:hypothetical protein